MATAGSPLQWLWLKYAELSPDSLYAALALRQRVFVVEQKCAYLDLDGLDQVAWHVLGWKRKADGSPPELQAYLRVLPPGLKYDEPSIGRVVTAPEARSTGLGRELFQYALDKTFDEIGEADIRISAQSYLEKFYSSFGFKKVGEEYLEDGIPHIEMLIRNTGPCHE